LGNAKCRIESYISRVLGFCEFELMIQGKNPPVREMIKVKNTTVLESLLIHAYHPMLIELLKWFCVRYSDTVFTGGYEERDYPSVHSTITVRGEDMRSRIYQDPQAVVDDVNAHWIYDTDRPWLDCAKFHDSGRGPHIHLQAHDNTICRGADK